MTLKSYILSFHLCIIFFATAVLPQSTFRTIAIQTQPNSTVWVDNVKRGVTDNKGMLKSIRLNRGFRKLRVRAYGYKEVSKILSARRRGTVRIVLVKTSVPAILAYHAAEKLVSSDKEKSIALYKQAVKLRPNFAEAYLGLARVLTGRDNDEAFAAIANARKYRRLYAEASAVEGRIFRSESDSEKAIDSFERAIDEGKGFQPEAYTGLGLIYKSKAESAQNSGDSDEEEFYYQEATKSFGKAIEQLSATEPVLYFLVGQIYEKTNKPKKAIAVYRKFLRDFPVSNERSVMESFIVQIQKELRNEQ